MNSRWEKKRVGLKCQSLLTAYSVDAVFILLSTVPESKLYRLGRAIRGNRQTFGGDNKIIARRGYRPDSSDSSLPQKNFLTRRQVVRIGPWTDDL